MTKKEQMAIVEAVRTIILGTNKKITEHVKWNAPSFCYNNEDRVTFNLRKGIQLVFHRGAKVKDAKGFTFNDEGLFEWVAPDRGIVMFADLADVKKKKAKLKKVVARWVKVQ